MSEYQYYEFAAVDRPLDSRELAQVRALSTRAQITSTSFANTYHWGDFRGSPRAMVERYYDAFLYLANWGTRQLLLRFPTRLLGSDTARRYCDGDVVSSWCSGDHVLVAAVSEDEEGDFEGGGEGVLATVLPVRSEVLAGDERPLYLLWLLSVQSGEVEDEVVEPPVPANLDALTGAQAALVDFLRIDRDLVSAAAGSSPSEQDDSYIEAWVAGLAADERDRLLIGLLRGGDPFLRAETLRTARPEPVCDGGTRTAEQLRTAARVRREERKRVERARRAQAADERARRAAETRRKRLADLTAEGETAWARVARRIAEKKPTSYEAAVDLLGDLQEVTGKEEFARRIEALRDEHRRKPAFVERLVAAGLSR
jgi:hypothetical protein